MVATARRTLQRAAWTYAGLRKEILELSPLHWGVPSGPGPRIRNRSIELVECERLARVYMSVPDVDLSSRRFCSAGRLRSDVAKEGSNYGGPIINGGPVNARPKPNVRHSSSTQRRGISDNEVIRLEDGSRLRVTLSRICDRCTLRVTGYSSCIPDDVEIPVRRCQICRGKIENYCRQVEGTNPSPRRRRKERCKDLSTAHTHRNRPKDHQPCLTRDIRRKIWFKNCEIIPPVTLALTVPVLEPYIKYVDSTGKFRLQDIQKYLDEPTVLRAGVGKLGLARDRLSVYHTRAEEKPVKVTNSIARELGRSRQNPINVVLKTGRSRWRKGQAPKRTPALTGRKRRYNRYLERVERRLAHANYRRSTRDDRHRRMQERYRRRAAYRNERRQRRIRLQEASTRYYLRADETITDSRPAYVPDDGEEDSDRDAYYLTHGYTWEVRGGRAGWFRDLED